MGDSEVGPDDDSPVRDAPCVFPFIYRGRAHSACTTVASPDGVTPWCSTRVNSRGDHVTGNYGNCNANCPVEGTSRGEP